jgi:hypothetical protein
MSKISRNGAQEVQTFIVKPLQTVALLLQQRGDGSFEAVHPMIEMILKKAGEINATWSKIED